MSYKVNYDELDYPEQSDNKYEEFRKIKGHVTDFSFTEKPLYEKAVAEYGNKGLHIGDGYRKGCCALYRANGLRDLSNFWILFRKLKSQTKM